MSRRRPDNRVAPGGRIVVVGTGAESGLIIGTLNERGELVRFDEPPAQDPESWPVRWWRPVGAFLHGRRRSSKKENQRGYELAPPLLHLKREVAVAQRFRAT